MKGGRVVTIGGSSLSSSDEEKAILLAAVLLDIRFLFPFLSTALYSLCCLTTLTCTDQE